MSVDTATPGPTREAERLPLLDVLRGVSLLGILLSNMGLFSGPWREAGYVGTPDSYVGSTVDALVLFFINGKSYLMFALLFGLGFELQLARAAAGDRNIGAMYMRRLLMLFVIGIVHAVFLWEGDIVAMYAVLGFGLLLIRSWPSRTLLAAALILFLVSPVTQWISYTHEFDSDSAETSAAATGTAVTAGSAAARAQAVYGQGRYSDMVAYRVQKLTQHTERLWLNQAPTALAVFIFGLYVGRRRLIESIRTHSARWRRRLPWILAAALAVNLIYVIAFMRDHTRFELASLTLGAPLLCVVYIVSLALLLERPRWRARFSPFAAAGRLSLTNYLAQSAVCTTFFYGYGFGLYGRLSTTATGLIALAIFASQVTLSSWWLRHFHFGPIEWLLRSFVYARWQILRKTVPVAYQNRGNVGTSR